MAAAMRPFLSIVTRHMAGREALLARNRESVRAQTVDASQYEHVVFTDDDARGFGYARQMLVQAAGRLSGRYVLILDDDDVMENENGIALLKQAASKSPPAVVFRGRHGGLGILPRSSWEDRPRLGDIGVFDYILRADVFRRVVTVEGDDAYNHDFYMIDAAWETHGDEAVWLDAVICAADRQRMGARKVA